MTDENVTAETSEEQAQELRVFVTGASTGAGRATVRLLARQGIQVTGACESSAKHANQVRADGGIPTFTDVTRVGEIRSALKLNNANVIVHLAPAKMNGVPQMATDWDGEFLKQSANAVAEAAGQMGVEKIISLSFASVYGDTHGEAVDEEAHVAHDDMAHDIEHAEHAILDGGVTGYVLRAGYIYGGYSQATADLADAFQHSRGVYAGTAQKSWIHEADLASAVLALLEHETDAETTGVVFNVADDTPATPNKFAEHLSEVIGLGSVKYSSGGWRGLIFPPSAQEETLKYSTLVKSDKLKAETGWSPSYPSVADGMDTTTMVWRAEDVAEVDLHASPAEEETTAIVEAG